MAEEPPDDTSREIVRLAVPAFLALVAEPLFLLVDSAIIGHLGVAELAGLGVASAVLATAASVFVFLAYGTTAVVARLLGAGDRRAAASAGMDGLWLALLLGAVAAVSAFALVEPVCRLLGASGAVLTHATAYLAVSAWGLPGMLVVLAVTGVLRGFQDTRTPLVVSVLGFTANALLNLWFVYGLGWGVAGSAWGTVLAQTSMAAVFAVALLRIARREGAALGVHPAGVLRAALDGVPLIVRTVALRAILLLTVWVAAGLGAVPLAAHQVAFTIWSFLTFALDALAIAAQALTGKALGAGDPVAVRRATAVMVRWGVRAGALLGLAVVLTSPVLPLLFTPDPATRAALTAALVVVGLGQALSGYVFVLDGVLIGAGDGRWLAGAMVALLAAYVPLVLAVRAAGPWLLGAGAPWALVALWTAFTGFLAARAAFLGHRARGERWLVLGATLGTVRRTP